MSGEILLRLRLPWKPVILPLLWLMLILGGMVQLWNYSNAPGQATSSPAVWPQSPALAAPRSGWKLIMFVHPRCPCTRASLAELARIMRHGSGKIDANVLFYRPTGEPDSWCHSDLWNRTQTIPGVRTTVDADGREARRFGAVNSGYVVLYDAEDRLAFSGGITSARGHEGDSMGKSAILAMIQGRKSIRQGTATFGCRILDEEQTEPGEEASW